MKLQSRNRMFVDGPVQAMLVQRLLVHWFAFYFLLFLTLFTVEYFLRIPGATFWMCLSQVFSKHALLLVLVACLLPAFLYDTIKMSHRFAGPISRFKKSLKSLANGETVDEVNFRGNDFWKELSDDFNRVSQRISHENAKSAS